MFAVVQPCKETLRII